MELNRENNLHLIGRIISPFAFEHETKGENVFSAKIEVERNSGTKDVLEVHALERSIGIDDDWCGKRVKIIGQFRSRNYFDGNKRRLLLHVFAKEIYEAGNNFPEMNAVFLHGFLCQKPVYRKTPFNREITDILLAVNRPYGKTDYIPCILWGENARKACDLDVGSEIRVTGRAQSREYEKKLPDGYVEIRTVYEISISNMEVIK